MPRKKRTPGQRERIVAFLHTAGAASHNPDAYNKYAKEMGHPPVHTSTFYAALKVFRQQRAAGIAKGIKNRAANQANKADKPGKDKHTAAIELATRLALDNAYLKWCLVGERHGWFERFLEEREV